MALCIALCFRHSYYIMIYSVYFLFNFQKKYLLKRFLNEYRNKIIHGIDGQASFPILGDRYYCEVDISDKDQLKVKGDICVYDDWFETGDKIVARDRVLYYYGRI